VISDIQEVFGTQYELPELGPMGSNGMALPRDFEIPLASFDIDQSPWESMSYQDIHLFLYSIDNPNRFLLNLVVYKVAGKLYACEQDHTPFDVVAWHGKLVLTIVAMR
jgi:homogentisate 1,2-dioxygenase